MVFQESQPAYQIFNLVISLFCIFSGYLYAYLAAFRDSKFDEKYKKLEILALVIEVIFLFHLVIQFFMAEEEKVKFQKIAKDYIADGFWIDFIPIVPIQLINLPNNRHRLFYLIKLVRILKGFALFDVDKILRMVKSKQH